ncbi:urease accessory protein UreH [Aquibacillus saliphilus]|uniref:urease accessory protein UreH n=1 Tax=Aquibacillus saliphilus TaxID=1909422 RepID=UPI001CF03988|nr:urease accessory protein UreH [Aquibacillus saliphilus]
MTTSYLSVLFLGFILGIKHSLEPDHVIAVSTIASKSKKLWQSTLAGVYWGIGHTITLFIIGIIFILLKGEFSTIWAMSLEFLVGIMLVYLGISSMFFYKSYVDQQQGGDKRSTLKSMFIGLVHGLAGSAAMILLTMSSVSTVWEGSLFILLFGVGTIIGMLGFTTILGIPFVISKGKLGVNRFLTKSAGAVSFLFGVYYIYNLGITEGLFQMWMP